MSFGEALTITLVFEGGYINDPADHGGETKFGVTQHTLDAWRETHPETPALVRDLEVADVVPLYRADYWDAVNGDGIDAISGKMATCVFDAAVNHGPGTAARMFQRTVQAEPDGRVGKVTLSCFRLRKMALGELVLLEVFMERRRALYAQIIDRDHGQARFSAGWRRRRNALRAAVGLLPEDA